MAFNKSLLSYGGLTQGQALPYWPAFYNGYSVASGDYIAVSEIDKNNAINGFKFDLPYEAGNTMSNWTLVAKFAILNDQGEIIRYIGVRYKYTSEFAWGRTQVTGFIELGYFDNNSNWVHMADWDGRVASIDGDITYRFGLTCHICAGTVGEGTANEYDFFGATICVNAQAKTEEGYAWAGVLDARSYVQGKIRKTDQEVDPDFGPGSEPEGYNGYSFDDHSDVIDIPTAPQSVLSLGFINVYKCSANSLINFGAALFPDIHFPQSLSDVGEVLAAFADSIWNSKLIDYVISVHCVPGDVSASGQLEDIKVGTRTMTGIMARKIDSEYVDFNFGSINTEQLFNNFADYMCQCELYLPMYGFISLKPEEWNGGTISVKYRFNVIDGSFTAYVLATSNKSKLTSSLIGQYGGSCVVHLPVSNVSYASMFSSLIGAGAGVAMGVSGAGSAVAGALSASNAVVGAAQGADSKKSNSYNASSSFMSRRKPYLIISAPVPSFSTKYNIEQGLPSNIVYTLSQCQGLTIVDNPVLNFACSDEEAKAIIAALREGVII